MTPTTYTELTETADDHLTRALEQVKAAAATTQLWGSVAMQADVADALAHLGRVLAGPTPPSQRASSGRRRGPEHDILSALQSAGRAWDWSTPLPVEDPVAADLRHAARAIRAAADLWSTHRTPEGLPRTLESSRMRHPALLGAATRQWRRLAGRTGAIADALVEWGIPQRAADHEAAQLTALEALRKMASVETEHCADASPPIDITVARPGRRESSDPVRAVANLVDRVREAAWALAESGSAPAPVLANTAAMGMMLHRAASMAQSRAAQDRAGRPVPGHRNAAAAEAAQQARWAAVAQRIAAIRTAHPPLTVMQIERLDLARLLAHASSPASGTSIVEVAVRLTAAAEGYDEVAALHVRAIAAVQERGELYVVGRALTHDLLTRRPDLLHAKLTDRIVPVPTVVFRKLEDAYRAVADGRPAHADAVSADSTPAA